MEIDKDSFERLFALFRIELKDLESLAKKRKNYNDYAVKKLGLISNLKYDSLFWNIRNKMAINFFKYVKISNMKEKIA